MSPSNEFTYIWRNRHTELSSNNQPFLTLQHMQENPENWLQDNSESDNTPYAWLYFVNGMVEDIKQ